MKKRLVCLISIIFLLFFGGFGCKSDEVSEAEKAEFKRQISTELNRLDTQISQLESRVASSADKAEATMILKELQEKQREVHNEIERVQKAPGAHWDEVRVEVKELLSDLQASYDQANGRLP
jgi:predicted ribosome quality control (RQC) complex YloA/Tae2 family protein